MDIDIREDLFSTNLNELKPLFIKHYEEASGLYDLGIKFNLHEELYLRMEQMGLLLCIIARKDNKIVGYLDIFISNHPHHEHEKMGMVDCFFMDKSVRHLTSLKYMIKMFNIAEESLKKDGVSYIQFSSNIKQDLKVLANKLGYKVSDISYSKVL